MSTIVGNSEVFAIEYRLQSTLMLFGCIRLLFPNHLWVGDINESMMLGFTVESLKMLQSHKVGTTTLVFQTREETPSYELLVAKGNWSWGEAFDDFDLVYYAISDEQCIHFEWKLIEDYYEKYPGYPTGHQHVAVPSFVFDSVVEQFLRGLPEV